MPRRQNTKGVLQVGEDVRIAVDATIRDFLRNNAVSEIELPSSLMAHERAHVHSLANSLGLQSKSRGKGVNRYLTVYKREGSTIVQSDAHFQLTSSSRQSIFGLLKAFPITAKEKQDVMPPTDRDRTINQDVRDMNKSLGRIIMSTAQIPSPPGNVPELLAFRQTLPVWPMEEEIMRVICSNQVCIIEGQTGSGKTTQVPQFILDYHHRQNKPCRIIVTQPRRIAVVNVCERVCLEREDKPGNTVGYQIRLESRVSPKTLLTFCTTGVLLRTLMSGETTVAGVTHIIVDEVHERDKYTDFLLIAVRDLVTKFRNLHVVLMSATVQTDIFSKYFSNCPVVSVPGRQHPIREYFLEHILKQTGYMSHLMTKLKTEQRAKVIQKEQLEKWTSSMNREGKADASAGTYKAVAAPILGQGSEQVCEKTEVEPWLAAELDNAISDVFVNGAEEGMTHILNLILNENVSVDYPHSKTGVTPLMVAAARNFFTIAEQLLSLGANVWVKASNNMTALDWATMYASSEMADMIRCYSDQSQPVVAGADIQSAKELTEEEQELLNLYHASFNDENVDVDLLMTLLVHIHTNTTQRGAVLIFLPGYDDIVKVRERIQTEDRRLSESMKYAVFTLHSSMQTSDQRKVFRPTPTNTRKIILATNIAETSVTIDDVVYVIDTGKVKMKSFDALLGVCALRTEWISQACAVQRKGRAGRSQPGVCYHLFSTARLQAMMPHTTAEILRVPLQELCLQSKLLAPANTTIADFLYRAVEPPPLPVSRNAVQLLKTIDALDPWEDLTELGMHLLDLPVEPRLGKMLMYACVLKCLDPVLTIVCCLAYRDPFTLPSQPAHKRAANMARKKLGADSFSDHMVLLRVFQQWQLAKNSGWERAFCDKNYVSAPTMDMVLGTRAQLLSQLRASGFVKSRPPGDIRDMNTNSENWAVVKACLCAGLYPNLARVDREHLVLRTRKECKVSFHPSSTLREPPKNTKTSVAQSLTTAVHALPTDWVLFEEMIRCGRYCHVRTCTLVSPITVALFCGPAKLPLEAISEAEVLQQDADSDSEAEEKAEGQQSTLKPDEWVLFKVDAEVGQCALQLRQKWHSMFLRRMKAPNKSWTTADDAVIKTIVSVLTAEEQALNLTQPQGVGHRPRPCTVDRDDESLLAHLEARAGIKKPQGGNSPNKGHNPLDICVRPGVHDPLNTRYFIVKAPNVKAIDSSVAKGTWSFTPNTERKLARALKEGKDVVLVFSIQGSGYFQGVARLLPTSEDRPAEGGYLMPVYWVKRSNVPFQATKHLLNPLNENRKVQTSRDGQEIEPSVGAALCSLWDKGQVFQGRGYSGGPIDDGYGGRPIRGPHNHDYQVLQRNHGHHGGAK